jgi:hypothetical protein
MAKGFVYILSNAAFPGMLKIGFTRKVPSERAAELSTTGVPNPFVVEYYCLVEGDSELEAKVHRAMAVHRHRADREFFRVDINNAVRYIQAECPSPEHVWSRQPVIPVFESGAKPKLVECERCGAGYFWAIYCPKCGIKLAR